MQGFRGGDFATEPTPGGLACETLCNSVLHAPSLPLCSKLSRSEIGPFIGEFYQVQLINGSLWLPWYPMLLSPSLPQDQILTKCMIILRQEVVEERGEELCTCVCVC